MADFGSTYRQALKIVEDFLAGANELTKGNKERLERLGEIAGILASMEKEKDEVKEASTNKCTEIIWQLCETVLFGFYIEFTTKVEDRFSMVSEIESKQKEDETSKLPVAMQIKIDEAKYYLEKAKGRLEKIDCLLSKLVPKIADAFRKKNEIPDEEIADLDMGKSDVTCELEACKKYLDDAENAINLLESDINEEMKMFKIKIAAGEAGVGATVLLGEAVFGPVNDLNKSSIRQLAQRLVAGGFLMGSTLAVAAITLGVYIIIHNHRTSFMCYLEPLQSELRKAQSEYQINQKEIELRVNERMPQKP